jgi:signal transduction histidine kinase
MRHSLASRLAALYALLLGITVVLVIIASSVALVYWLSSFSTDILIAKHAEARFLASQYQDEGVPVNHAAQHIVDDLSGIGLRVAVYDMKGHFLAGDRTLRPRIIDRIASGQLGPPPMPFGNFTPPGPQASGAPRHQPGPPFSENETVGRLLYRDPQHTTVLRDAGIAHPEPFAITQVDGGYVAFQQTRWLVLVNLLPYWRVVVTIAILAILISWFLGRLFSRHALAPLAEVTDSLRALSNGDYTQRRFVTAAGDEVAALTEAYNDAAAGVASAMEQRRRIEVRMRQFVADAGHELRTPLTVIAGYIDVLRRGALEEPKVAKQILSTMALEKEHMRVLIDRLMRLARLDAETQPSKEEIDVAELFQGQCDAAHRLDEQRQIDYSTDGVSTIYADRTEIGEALWNIVENALKYAPGAPIHMSASREDGSTVLRISDEGPGMSETERLHAFERFFRGDSRGEITGTGLGLAIAKRAVDRAGGDISIDSAPGSGTRVTIRL